MMQNFHRTHRLLAGALVSLSALGCQTDAATEEENGTATTAGAPTADALTQRQMDLVNELQVLDQQLTPVRTLALQDPEIQAQEQALIVEVDEVMERLSPGFLEARDRFEALRVEYGAAQQAGDQERLQTLGTELQGLQAQIQGAQTAAAAEEDISEQIESFRQDLFDWMRAEDPSTGALLDRVVEITDELESMGPPGGA